jgi:Coproporphyrinogen III oxidase and related Fe-S oxidoreductases
MISDILRVLLTRSIKPLAFTNEADSSLNLNDSGMGIYVHIPFCSTICSFCPYNKVVYDAGVAAAYKDALLKEIDMSGRLCSKKTEIASVYFGGGTPSLMIDELPDIIGALKRNFTINGNIGIELHPRDINEDLMNKLKLAGFDMVSIGIQSFQESSLKALGRQYIDGAYRVRMAKDAGFKTIDVDLIFGIPSQNGERLRRDFLTAFESGATQVSTYPFIDFSYANNKNKPLGRQEKKRMLRYLEKVSCETGCERTSVWTFAQKDTLRYSSITRDLFLGFGPSAGTLLKDMFKINTFSVEEYIKCVNGGRIPTALTLKFNERTRALYWLFWNSYTLRIDSRNFKNLLGKDIEDIFKHELRFAIFCGLIKRYTNGYELTKRGAYLYHLIEQHYTHQYIDKTWRIAGREPWPKEIKLF